MLTRMEAVAKLRIIMEELRPVPDKHLRAYRAHPLHKQAWHYGLCEFRALLDAIYEGPPGTRDEEVHNVEFKP